MYKSYPINLTLAQWYAQMKNKREKEEILDTGEPKLQPPTHKGGHDLDLSHKKQTQTNKQKELSKCVSLSDTQNKKKGIQRINIL